MVDLSRRSFLIGSAAALAVVQLPPPVMEPAIVPVSVPLRRVYDLGLSWGDWFAPSSIVDRYVGCNVHRGTNEQPLLGFVCHPRATVRWVARPGEELLFTEEQPIRFAGNSADLNAVLFSKDQDNRTLMENYRWRNGKLDCISAEFADLAPGKWVYWGDEEDIGECDDADREQELLAQAVIPAPAVRPTSGFFARLLGLNAGP